MSDRAIDQAVGLGDDDARPNDAAPQADTPPAAAPAAAYDPDLAELQAAQAAVEAEQRGAAAAPDAGQQAAPQATQPPPDGGQPPKPKAVPYDRFVEANRRRQEAENRAAYLEGALAERGRQPGTTPPAADATPPPAAPAGDPITTQVKEARSRLRTEAERFDRGEITLAEFESVRGEVDDRIAELNLQRVQQTQGRQPDSLADQAIEQTHLNTLLARHPYAANLTDKQVADLEAAAYIDLANEGMPIRNSGKAESLRLRERIALLSDFYGPRWGVKPSTTTAPVPHQQAKPTAAPLSPAATARAAKIELAASLPPDPAGFGRGAPADLSEDRLAMMSDEEIGALPAHIRNRVLQQSA